MKRKIGHSSAAIFTTGLVVFALAASSVGCGAKTANSGRVQVFVEIDRTLMLDTVRLTATASGKPRLTQDFPVSGMASLDWTILIANPKAGLTATLVASGLRGSGTVVSFTAFAEIAAGKTIPVYLRLAADCVGFAACPNADETCDHGACVKRFFGGTPDGGGGEVAADVPIGGGDSSVDRGGGGTGGVGGVGGVGGPDAGGGEDAMPTIQCAVDQHLCGDRCVGNSDVRTCGTSCSPCDLVPDGTPSCDGIKCGAECPAGKKLCKGGCIDMSAACEGACPTATHACLAACPSDQSVNACGTSCNPCPVPAGASQATCDGVKCDFQCTTGFHKCSAVCARDEDAAACGLACTRCPADPNGSAQCVGGACSLRCNTGFHACGGRCVSDISIDTCGTSCNACVAPMGGTATCQAGQCGVVCPAGRKPCLGMCIDTTAACSGVCPAGTHNCTGNCASDTSVNSCGPTLCTTCTVPPGASQATCDGTKCDFTCGPGFHRCGTACAADSSAAACGAACTACPADPNGTAACIGGACGLMCKSGFHLCAGRCVSNAAVATCGPTACAACQAPTAGTVTCDGLACVPACPTGTKICSGACIPNANACNGVCPAGSHACAGVCASNSAVATCGASCMPCAAPTNGTATCNGTTCGIVCNTTFHNCGGACVSNTSISSCGATACTACTPPANATASCNGTACGFTCNSGFHNCSGACVSNASVSTCGTLCTACTAPANSTPTCNGTTCGSSCNTGYHACGGGCVLTTDPRACGGSCTDCSQPNATPACNSATGTCQNTCVGLPLGCTTGTAGRPSCGSWDFETGPEQWLNTSAQFGPADASGGGTINNSTSHAISGTHSLAIPHNNPTGMFGFFSSVRVQLCPSGQGLNLSSRTLRASFFLVSNSGPIDQSVGSIEYSAYNGSTLLLNGAWNRNSWPTGQFVTVSDGALVPPPEVPQTITAIEIFVRTNFSPWVGMVYLDDVRIE